MFINIYFLESLCLNVIDLIDMFKKIVQRLTACKKRQNIFHFTYICIVPIVIMIGAVKPIANYLKLKNINIYDTIFVLHSKCTVVILLIFTLLLSAKQYFGDPIRCMTDLKFPDFVHSYCWTFGTFSVPTTIVDARKTIAVGVGPNTVQHLTLRYYQWVVIVLLLEASFFYLPAFLWKLWEGKLLEQLCSPVVQAIIPPKKSQEHCYNLIGYFNVINQISHRNYVIKYFICELLNLIISVVNILFLDKFLNGYWSRYWDTISILSLNNWEIWNYYSSQFFPKLAKCTIFTFGLGGSINNNDALCMLPLNILNEKIFTFLWFWFILITLLAILKIIYDICLVFCPKLRIQLLRIRVNDISYFQMRTILMSRSFFDWFILYKISLNANPMFFRNFLVELHNSASHKRKCSII